jgi:hypothetical protein
LPPLDEWGRSVTTNESKTSAMRLHSKTHYAIALTTLATILAGVTFASILIVDASRYQHSISALCGTWRGENNNLIILNRNGTGLGYVNVNEPQHATFIRWGQKEKELSIYYERKDKSWYQMIEQARRGLPACQHFHYEIQRTTENEFVITDPTMNNQTLTFRREDHSEIADKNDHTQTH